MRTVREDAGRRPWAVQLLALKPVKIATVALANKSARIGWALLSRNEVYVTSAA
jgi:transposase